MERMDKLAALAEKAWAHRKQHGFLKNLPKEIQAEAAEVARSGKSVNATARALGVNRKTIADWIEKYKSAEASFSELVVLEEKPSGAMEVKVSIEAFGCCVEITGGDFVSVQALLKRIEGA